MSVILKRSLFFLSNVLPIVIYLNGCSSTGGAGTETLPPPYWQEMYAHHDNQGSDCTEGEECASGHDESVDADKHDPQQKATLILEYTPW